jgi:hypothetical protein
MIIHTEKAESFPREISHAHHLRILLEFLALILALLSLFLFLLLILLLTDGDELLAECTKHFYYYIRKSFVED